MRPEIVVSIPVKASDPEMPAGKYIPEFRLDYLPPSEIESFLSKKNYSSKSIVTVRDASEGGFYKGDIEYKLGLLGRCHSEFLDVEYAHLDKVRENMLFGKTVIFSVHDFRNEIEPSRIIDMVESLPDKGCMLKVAMKMKDPKDYLELATLYSGRLLIIDLNSLPNRILFSIISGTYLYTYFRESLAESQPRFDMAERILNGIFRK
ncbi:MAG: type I 3-dehydroquinate dehydratase [Thermoplasmataceae archaeon]